MEPDHYVKNEEHRVEMRGSQLEKYWLREGMSGRPFIDGYSGRIGRMISERAFLVGLSLWMAENCVVGIHPETLLPDCVHAGFMLTYTARKLAKRQEQGDVRVKTLQERQRIAAKGQAYEESLSHPWMRTCLRGFHEGQRLAYKVALDQELPPTAEDDLFYAVLNNMRANSNDPRFRLWRSLDRLMESDMDLAKPRLQQLRGWARTYDNHILRMRKKVVFEEWTSFYYSSLLYTELMTSIDRAIFISHKIETERNLFYRANIPPSLEGRIIGLMLLQERYGEIAESRRQLLIERINLLKEKGDAPAVSREEQHLTKHTREQEPIDTYANGILISILTSM